jgi:ABC-type transport system substrate-binding protein
MHTRLFGILASVAVIVAACGGATSSSAPPASAGAPGGSEAPAASSTPVASAANLADQQILHIDLGQEPATLDPNKAQSSDAIAVLSGLQRGLVYFDKDLKIVPELATALPEISADAKSMTFTLKDGL